MSVLVKVATLYARLRSMAKPVPMILRRCALPTALLVALLWLPGTIWAQSDVDQCINGVDKLVGGAAPSANSGALATLTTQCERAAALVPDSDTVRLSLAQLHIWSGSPAAALALIERMLGVVSEASDLAAQICSNSRSSRRARELSCAALIEHPPQNPTTATSAGRKLIERGEGELGLQLVVAGASGGSADAASYLSALCETFDLERAAFSAPLSGTLAQLDPAYVGALACEGAFASAPQGSPQEADFGFKYAGAMTYFDSYDITAQVLLELAGSSDPQVSGRAAGMAADICLLTAGDPKDPALASIGVPDRQIIVERARPACEVAAYLNPDRAELHHALSRVYSVAGDPDNAAAARQEAQRLGYALASPFDPSRYSNPDLIAAFYHGDLDTVLQIESTYRKLAIQKLFLGDKLNLYSLRYLGGFIGSAQGEEKFKCPVPPEVVFSGKALHELQRRAQLTMLEEFGNPLQFIMKMHQGMGAMLQEMPIEQAMQSGNFMPLMKPFAEDGLSMEAATIHAERDASMFLNQFQCGEASRPLVENIEAFIMQEPMPHRDLFYMSRYGKPSASRTFYDQCGNQMLSEGMEDVAAAQACRCIAGQLIKRGFDDASYQQLAQTEIRVALVQSGNQGPLADIAKACSIH